MKSIITILLLLAGVNASAQIYILEDSRSGAVITNRIYEAFYVDFADKKSEAWQRYTNHPGWIIPQRLPAMVDMEYRVSVPIETRASATNELATERAKKFPARARLHGIDRDALVQGVSTNRKNGAASMREDISALSDLVQWLLEQQRDSK